MGSKGDDGIYDAGMQGQGNIGNVTDDNVYADLPGVYEVRAIVTDRHLMTSLSNVEVFEIIKVDGSRVPVNNLTFPYRHLENTSYYEGEEDNEYDPVGVLESGSTELNATEILTMTTKSRYVLSSRAMDPDGALAKGVQYTVTCATCISNSYRIHWMDMSSFFTTMKRKTFLKILPLCPLELEI